MASIPRDLVSQMSLTTPRSGAKSLAEAEPFSFVFQEKSASAPSSSHKYAAPARDERPAANVDQQSPKRTDEDEDVRASDEPQDRAPVKSDQVESSHASADPNVDTAPSDVQDGAQENDKPTEEPVEESQDDVHVAAAAAATASQVQPELSDELTDSTQTEQIDVVKNAKKQRRSVQRVQQSQATQTTAEQDATQEGDEVDVAAGRKSAVQREALRRAKSSHKAAGATADSKTLKSNKAALPDNSANETLQRVQVQSENATDQPKKVSGTPAPKVGGKDAVERTSTRNARRTPSQPTSVSNTTEAHPTATKTEATPTTPLTDAIASSDRPTTDGQPVTPTNHAAPVAQNVGTNHRVQDHLVPRSSRKSGDAPGLTQTEQNRFLQRVARAFDAAKNRDGGIRIRLSPPELGSLRLEVRMQQGGMVARLEAETPATRTLLVENLPALRERLAEQGIRVEQFEVDLLDRRDQNDFGNPSHTSDDSAAYRQPEPERGRLPTADAPQREERQDVTAQKNAHGINVII